MKAAPHRIVAFSLVSLMTLFISIGHADWDEGGSHKMHWPQMPDLSIQGIDINATAPYVLADNFLCTEDGLITNIHIWGSWLYDEIDTNALFVLSIHTNAEATVEAPYNKPGVTLWYQPFTPDQYVRREYATQIEEGWMDPPDEYIFPADTKCFQYNFSIDPETAFEQNAGTMYWLNVQVLPADMQMFGWKTADPALHWEDDATWTFGDEPSPVGWTNLVYPFDPQFLDPPLAGTSIDLAFVIDGGTPPAEDIDWGDAPDPSYPTLAANNGASHIISGQLYLGSNVDADPDGQPDAHAEGDDNDGNEDDDGVIASGYLVPGVNTPINVIASARGTLNAWADYNADGDWGDAGEHIFADVPLSAGTNTLSMKPPLTAQRGPSFARFRLSTATGISYDGQAADGEVEDYEYIIRDRCMKWQQEPDCDIGLNIMSWRDEGEEALFKVADDWWCDGRPISAIEWWGSYIHWEADNPEPEEPPPLQLRPNGFLLTWYTDIPALEGEFSRPGDVIATNYYPLLPYGTTNYMTDTVVEKPYCVSVLDFYAPGYVEHEYSYYLELSETNEWNEKEGNVYWLSIDAVYTVPPEPDTFPWGWKTTNPEWNWNDDAVLVNEGSPWEEMHYPPLVWPWDTIAEHPYDGTSVNMAFRLYTDICPARCKKWIQPPDMVWGTDMPSWSVAGDMPQGYDPIIRADDFISDGRPITDIHWWGSYLWWQSHKAGSVTNPIPPPTGVWRPSGFELSWHLNDPTGLCVPGPLLTNIFVDMDQCHEMFFGTVTQDWNEAYEHEYQYYVDLNDHEISGPWNEMAGTQYWLNIAAVFPPEFSPVPREYGEPGTHEGWGWKISNTNYLCDSALTTNDMASWTHDTLPWPHPLEGMPFDLAFELTTTNVPGSNSVVAANVAFTNIDVTADLSQGTMITTGYCGCGKQVLQRSVDITNAAAWTDIMTNTMPRPVNTWSVGPISSQEFYRVIQRN